MPNVLPTSSSVKTPGDRQLSAVSRKEIKHKISFLGVILTIILSIVIILLCERIIFDLNRTANPIIESTISSARGRGNYYIKPTSRLVMEKSSLSGTRIYYPREKTGEYKLYKLLIHSAFILPLFLLMFLLYYWLNMKKRNPYWQVVVWGYLVASIWMLLHLIGETGKYIIDQYKNAAIYIILVFLAVVLTSLAVFIQKKKMQE